MKELKADAYLERLDQLQREYAEMENWVDKERERVVIKIQREEAGAAGLISSDG